jgi:hypothetical protein
MAMTRPTPISAAKARPSNGVPSREIQELWFAMRRTPWKSVAIMPAHAGGSARELAEDLQQVAQLTGRSARVVVAEGLELPDIASLAAEMDGKGAGSAWVSRPRSESGSGRYPQHPDDADLVITALESVLANPLILPLALANDAVLLVVELGRTDMESARKSVELIGRDRLIGCALIEKK